MSRPDEKYWAEKIAARVVKARSQLGISRRALARKLPGYDGGSATLRLMERCESGKSIPRFPALVQICDTLDIPLEEMADIIRG